MPVFSLIRQPMPFGVYNLPSTTQLVKWQNHVSEWRLEVVLETPGIHPLGERSRRGGVGIPGRSWSSLGSRGAFVGLGATAIYQEVWKYFSIVANSVDIQVYIVLSRRKTRSHICWLQKPCFLLSPLSTPTNSTLITISSHRHLTIRQIHVWAYLV